MSTAYLGLGSNLGDRRGLLVSALAALRTRNVAVDRVSSVYETAPVGVTEQPDFLNIVARVTTGLGPDALLASCLEVEAALGRTRRERWGPRTVDIDLLWFDGIAMKAEALTLPHPRMLERAFVLFPLAEIAPELMLDGKTAAVRAAELTDQGVRKAGPLEDCG